MTAAVGGAEGSEAAAAAAACSLSGDERSAVLVVLGDRRAPRPTLLASAGARALEERLAGSSSRVAARGRICRVSAVEVDELPGLLAAIGDDPCVVSVPGPLLLDALDLLGRRAHGVLLRAELAEQHALTALAVAAIRERGARVAVLKQQLPWLVARRALAGVLPQASGAVPRGLLKRLCGQSGQALPLAMCAAIAILVALVGLVAVAGAVTGKGRVQRAADLAAVSAARVISEDRRDLRRRARAVALEAARRNGVSPARVRVDFPDRPGVPLTVRVVVRAKIELAAMGTVPVRAEATAQATPAGGTAASAAGGGYAGPLARRDGERMRPDVAAAFDCMEIAARRAGLELTVTSGYRSDAEQAALFAANPDPRWVAPPGRSLHRCATELDLGPTAAYPWLAANAGRFGFVRRYAWEPWHFGFTAGPAPCSAAPATGGGSVPAFVPARFRAPILRSSRRWRLSPGLLAAQLMVESGFDPGAVSPAGARGIAQFMPGTAAAYGLADPFDPFASIDAQGRLMSDLLGRFGSVILALAAYNAGPAPVQACDCVPPYPETRAYVARVIALADGGGGRSVGPFRIRLID